MFDRNSSLFLLHPIVAAAVLILLGVFLFSAFVSLKGSAGRKRFLKGDYRGAIRNANWMLGFYRKTDWLFRQYRYNIAMIDHLYFMLAVSYFATGNDELFLQSIHARSRLDDTGKFWLALYSLRKYAPILAQEYVAETTGLGDKQLYKTFLEGMLADRAGDSELAKSKLQEIYRQLNLPILKQIADETLKKA